MNPFAIQRHSPIKRAKKKNRTKEAPESAILREFATCNGRGSEMTIRDGEPGYTELRSLKGNVRCARKKLFLTHHIDRINVLHCGEAPRLS